MCQFYPTPGKKSKEIQRGESVSRLEGGLQTGAGSLIFVVMDTVIGQVPMKPGHSCGSAS
ncbi:MAG TPA: hypothetical protein DCR87_02425 [Acidobacteria bacterium]|nr:hypothetical protein [Acidobacteriota bacterium]